MYVRPFPNVDEEKLRISRGGGSQPVWSLDGKQLFYLGPGVMMAVPIITEPVLSAGNASELFDLGEFFRPTSETARTYDRAPDGRFLKIGGGATVNSLVGFLNFTEELKQLVPVD